MSHLSILANGTPIALKPDQSVDIELQNPLFNDSELFSYPIELPFAHNRHYVGNLDDQDSDARPIDLENAEMRIIVDGLPLATGVSVVQDDEELTDSISVNIDESTMTFDDLISDLMCNEVPVRSADKERLQIGEKLGNIHIEAECTTNVAVDIWAGKDVHVPGVMDGIITGIKLQSKIEPQALGFSCPAECVIDSNNQYNQAAKIDHTISYDGGHDVIIPVKSKSFINVSDAYPTALFANARVCYNHLKINSDGETSDEQETTIRAGEPENYGKYWVLDADRQQSGVCFFVMYFLDCLFEYLGVSFDKSEIECIEDLNRLVFFTTQCHYDVEAKNAGGKDFTASASHGDKLHPETMTNLFRGANEWLRTRGCGGKLGFGEIDNSSVKACEFDIVGGGIYDVNDISDIADRHVQAIKGQSINLPMKDGSKVEVKFTSEIARVTKIKKMSVSVDIQRMFANGKNFPNESVSSVIDSLKNAFGIQFSYDPQMRTVKAYMMRNVFRSTESPRPLLARIYEMNKVSEKISGVRMCYNSESESKEQRNNITNGVKDYDTSFDYIDYTPENLVIGKSYKDIFYDIGCNDMNCYIDIATGNAFRVKIDSDYTTQDTMHPVLFEVGQWKGVTYRGHDENNNPIFRDSSTMQDKHDEDYIHEFGIDFQPIDFNDVNYAGELKNVSSGYAQSLLAVFVDDDMEHEFITQLIDNSLSNSQASFTIRETLNLIESYDPTGSDDANSPLQTHDWGLAVAIMRGGGSQATTTLYDSDYDSFGNSKWKSVAAEYTMSSDTMDQFGNEYDYNGVNEGIGDGERFSLKIRAAKSVSFDVSDGSKTYTANTPLCNSDVARRGLFDMFMSEYAYFLFNRKKYKVRCLMTAAQLLDIKNHWKEWWLIECKKCLINKASVSINNETGIESVELEIFSL